MKISGPLGGITGIYNKNKSIEKINKTSEIIQKKDVFSVSEQAKDYQTINKALKSIPDVRQDKINKVQEKYLAGTYNVDGKDIAEKIAKSVIDRKA